MNGIIAPLVVIHCSEGLSDAEPVKKMWPMNWMDRFDFFPENGFINARLNIGDGERKFHLRDKNPT